MICIILQIQIETGIYLQYIDFMIDALKKYNFWDKNVKGTGIKRQAYLYRLDRLNTGRPVVTVTGLRRAGKSFIIRQFIDFLIRYKKVSPCQIFYANLFLRELNFLKNPNMFQEAVALWKSSQKVDINRRMYIFIDEVQEINEWQKLVSSYYEDYTAEYKIFITGSNSKLLSGELGTYLAGRSHELVVYPLSFEEYLLLYCPSSPLDFKLINDYKMLAPNKIVNLAEY